MEDNLWMSWLMKLFEGSVVSFEDVDVLGNVSLVVFSKNLDWEAVEKCFKLSTKSSSSSPSELLSYEESILFFWVDWWFGKKHGVC